MKTSIAMVILIGVETFAQSQSPVEELAQIKIAAEAGDAAAEDKLAEQYSGDPAQAIIWYRKAAVQGYLHAQGALGHLLLTQYQTQSDIKPEEPSAVLAEAYQWISSGASQDNHQAEADLAGLCLEGKLVKQDLIEAYKWGDLSTRGASFDAATIMGKTIRDEAILKMSRDQIEEARKRVASFVPKKAAPVESKNFRISSGFAGSPGERAAIINHRTFIAGDRANVLIDGKRVTIQCLEVKDASVVIAVDGVAGTRELKLKPDQIYTPSNTSTK